MSERTQFIARHHHHQSQLFCTTKIAKKRAIDLIPFDDIEYLKDYSALKDDDANYDERLPHNSRVITDGEPQQRQLANFIGFKFVANNPIASLFGGSNQASPSSSKNKSKYNEKGETIFDTNPKQRVIGRNNRAMKNNNNKQSAGATAGDRHHHQHIIDVENPLKQTGKSRNNSNSDSGDQLANDLGSSKKSTGLCCSIVRWIFIFMAILLIVAAILFVVLSQMSVLDHQDNPCYQQQNFPFRNNYQLFATKTTYTTAFNYLTKSSQAFLSNSSPLSSSSVIIKDISGQHQQPTSQAQAFSQQQPPIDKSSIKIPNVFSAKYSLESLNKRLVEQEQCKPIQLYFYGRHAARLPGNVRKFNDNLASFQAKITHVIQQQQERARRANQSALESSSSSSSSSSPSPMMVSSEHESSVEQAKQQQQQTNKTSSFCSDPLVEYQRWQTFATDDDQANLVTELGALETRGIAERYKLMFPHLFDGAQTEIELGVTSDIRTAQTAIEFSRLLDNYRGLEQICPLDQFPSADIYRDPKKAKSLPQNSCFSKFNKAFVREELSFHDRCERGTEITERHGFKLEDHSHTQFIADALTKRLKLTEGHHTLATNGLSVSEMLAAYDACRYETSLKPNANQSIWCKLFLESELRFLEYHNDVNDFFNSAYGSEDLANSACAILGPLKGSVLIAKRRASSREDRNSQKAKFHFTHSEVMQRLLAASFDLSEDPEYSPANVRRHLKEGTAPKDRQWQTSLFTPFSANLAFILYECPDSGIKVEPVGDSNKSKEEVEMDVSLRSPLKIVASLNEQPVLLNRCNDYVCDAETLAARGGLLFQPQECEKVFKRLCKK